MAKTETTSFQEASELSLAELRSKLSDARKGYYQTREDVLSGKEGNYKKLRDLKKSVARLATAIRQKEAVETQETK